MSTCPVIIQVFFDGCEATDAICPPTWYGKSAGSNAKDYKGMPYWQAPDGKGAVYRWSFDMITCSDERWVVFGPFEDRAAALQELRALPPLWILGWRIINEHCAAYCGGLGKCYGKNETKWEFYREAWTDG